jgi:hypothetical protein
VRLLARVTGERRGARYDWHKMLVGTVPEKKNMEKEERRKKKGSRSGLWKLIKKKNFSIRGVMVRGQLFFNKTALAL